jgi:hypothetical protein
MLCSLLGIAVSRIALPDDFIAEVRHAENAVEENFQVVAGSRVAMQVQAARGFQDAVKLQKADGHHSEISHHAVFSEK